MQKPQQNLEMALRILADPNERDRDIIEIAFDSGFYEIKDFNTEFRKATDMCPTEYRAFHTQFKRVTGMSPQEYIDEHGEPAQE